MSPEERFFSISNDFRSPYARDRDRIIHSGSFRHLEYKTQVFLNSQGDFFRTRLTHSIEVSQIARSICSHLGLQESLAESIALSHDLGHTPFGHIGGDTLDECLKERGFSHGFEHNFQSFRVVTKLEQRYKAFLGLNLTYATLEGILKHSYPYNKPFLPQDIRDAFALDTHPSIEAMIVDRADEIAYISHDIDDGIASGLISFEMLKSSELIQTILQKVYDEGIYENEDEMFRYRFSSHLINHLVYSLLEFSRGKIDNSRVLASLIPASEEIPIGFELELETQIKKLKKILYKELYQHKSIMRKMFAGKQAVIGLFNALMEEPKMLPRYYLQQLDIRNTHRVIADYIASMSDRYAMELYNELYGREG
ncbi:MAG: dNTP triphosphohydrolase [Sulfuricurvum sp.]|uniref:deoxyguanosinetriphosphate triphosphohydrolase family protein n=1 Tax=Sulfuricurvum sp. TaxID=2025608 RepID=UPI002612AAED|nr:dNTP triphosphohydrolase [Sulfuricurvum sp.]MDD2828343.1 dNTP triphosphohydrolase [Sulfuricurvum sp.]MDD4949348.1 dNTP triphosphohydrolase [Sulfuricurvum sp.]